MHRPLRPAICQLASNTFRNVFLLHSSLLFLSDLADVLEISLSQTDNWGYFPEFVGSRDL